MTKLKPSPWHVVQDNGYWIHKRHPTVFYITYSHTGNNYCTWDRWRMNGPLYNTWLMVSTEKGEEPFE